jgi:hypothetical protein
MQLLVTSRERVETMNVSMSEQIAYEHGADLRRAAAAYRRVPSRADKARRETGGFHVALPRRHTAVGCEA